MKKHFFFDMDGTLTRSRTEITREMSAALMSLVEAGSDVIVVSGAKQEQMFKQLGSVVEEVAIMAQNGNESYNSIGGLLWRRELSEEQRSAVIAFIDRIKGVDNGDLVQDRGCQISFSAIGHNAPLKKKEAYDPGGKKRKVEIDAHKHTIKELAKLGVHVAIGGTTCIDFYTQTKGENVEDFIVRQRWLNRDCVYVGDALFEGGNDHTVVGVIPTLQVSGPDEALTVIKGFIAKA